MSWKRCGTFKNETETDGLATEMFVREVNLGIKRVEKCLGRANVFINWKIQQFCPRNFQVSARFGYF